MSSTSKDGLLAVASSFTCLCTISVGLRFYARKLQKLQLMADDWILIPTLASYLGAAICIYIAIDQKVLGYSSFDFTDAQIAAKTKTAEQLYVAIVMLLNFTLALTKISILFFYHRVFCTGLHVYNAQWFNIATVMTLLIVSSWLVVFTFLAGFQCGTHFSALWDGTYAEYCYLSFPFLYGLAISDFLLDFWILVLPLPILLPLQLNLLKKLSIVGVFLLALIGLGASIARMVQFIEVENGGYSVLFSDHYRTETQALYFSMLEAGLSVVVANLPSLWLFFTSVLPEMVMYRIRGIVSLKSLLLPRRSDLSRNSSANAAGRTASRPSDYHNPSISTTSSCPDVSSGQAKHK